MADRTREEQGRILVTGANGFIGSTLCALACARGLVVRAAVRSTNASVGEAEKIVIGAMNGSTQWTEALREVDAVIHLAARAHVMQDRAADPLAAFREVNLHGTVNLARQAAGAGVRRFVFVSSIKVNGEETRGTFAFSEAGAADPHDPYAISKWEAEQALHQIARDTGMEVVVVRPPLVYGPGVKGNFARMLKLLASGIPLPFASVHNQRSLIYVGNLVEALLVCVTHPAAAGRTYLVSDGEDVSTPGLLRRLGDAMGRRAHLFPCPMSLLRLAGMLSGRSGEVARLVESLRVDGSRIRQELGWTPPYTLQQGLQATADWYRELRR